MTWIQIDAGEVPRVQRRFLLWGRRAERNRNMLAQTLAETYRDLVHQHASGRPGPDVITGIYRGSIQATPAGDGVWDVTTGQPEALRLEFGFVGVDALGRHYQQPAFPHWRPALADLHARVPGIYRVWLRGVIY